jgi:hypothetical protein
MKERGHWIPAIERENDVDTNFSHQNGWSLMLKYFIWWEKFHSGVFVPWNCLKNYIW